MQQPPLQPPYYWPQPPLKRKRNSIVWWISTIIPCVVLVITILIAYLLTGHSFSLGGCNLPSATGNNTPHFTLASTYHGAFVWFGPGEPVSLISINENQQGAICGTLVLGTLNDNSHPFTGNVTGNNVTFT